jgi:hypothetical protein
MDITNKLERLFKGYQDAFIGYDIDKLSACYHLPCTLNTPEQITLLNSSDDFKNEFETIFSQLKEGNISSVVVKNSTYSQMTEQLYLVCIDWDFIDEQGEIFADFAAIYHVIDVNGELKIVNVTSHDLECTLTLPEKFSWSV